MSKIKYKQFGFTLIETIITLTILAFLTMMAARTIQQAFRAQVKIQNQIDQVSHVKDTLRLMERDINLAYHYIDLQKDIADELNKMQKKQGTNNNSTFPPNNPNPLSPPPPPGSPASNNPFLKTENRVDPITQFIGKEEEMHFVTLNTVRLVKDAPQANFGEVSYFLNTCKNRADKKFESGKCLFRRTSPLVDKDPTKGGAATQLLPDITEFRLRYYSKLQKDWRKDWNSKEDVGDTNTKGRYPEAVEISLTVETQPKDPKKEKKKKISIQMVVPVHFPNNKDPNQQNGANPLDPFGNPMNNPGGTNNNKPLGGG